MLAEPAAAQNLFPTLYILASLPGKNSPFALKQFSRRALRYGGRVPRKISESRLGVHAPMNRQGGKKVKRKEKRK